MVKASDTGGVKPMPIAGRYVSERERLRGMTDAERAFRHQWLKDQLLAPNEPRHVPEMYEALYNPIRRFYRWPLDKFQRALEPKLGAGGAFFVRYFTGKGVLTILGAFSLMYYFKYNTHDWTRTGGWKIKRSRVIVVEGDEGYPKLSDRSKGSDYYSAGFNENQLKL